MSDKFLNENDNYKGISGVHLESSKNEDNSEVNSKLKELAIELKQIFSTLSESQKQMFKDVAEQFAKSISDSPLFEWINSAFKDKKEDDKDNKLVKGIKEALGGDEEKDKKEIDKKSDFTEIKESVTSLLPENLKETLSEAKDDGLNKIKPLEKPTVKDLLKIPAENSLGFLLLYWKLDEISQKLTKKKDRGGGDDLSEEHSGGGFANFVKGLQKSLEGVGSLILKVAVSLLLFAAAAKIFGLLTEQDWDALIKGLILFGVVVGLMVGLALVVNTFKTNLSQFATAVLFITLSLVAGAVAFLLIAKVAPVLWQNIGNIILFVGFMIAVLAVFTAISAIVSQFLVVVAAVILVSVTMVVVFATLFATALLMVGFLALLGPIAKLFESSKQHIKTFISALISTIKECSTLILFAPLMAVSLVGLTLVAVFFTTLSVIVSAISIMVGVSSALASNVPNVLRNLFTVIKDSVNLIIAESKTIKISKEDLAAFKQLMYPVAFLSEILINLIKQSKDAVSNRTNVVEALKGLLNFLTVDIPNEIDKFIEKLRTEDGKFKERLKNSNQFVKYIEEMAKPLRKINDIFKNIQLKEGLLDPYKKLIDDVLNLTNKLSEATLKLKNTDLIKNLNDLESNLQKVMKEFNKFSVTYEQLKSSIIGSESNVSEGGMLGGNISGVSPKSKKSPTMSFSDTDMISPSKGYNQTTSIQTTDNVTNPKQSNFLFSTEEQTTSDKSKEITNPQTLILNGLATINSINDYVKNIKELLTKWDKNMETTIDKENKPSWFDMFKPKKSSSPVNSSK